MNEDTTKRGPRDRGRINLDEDYELRYWMEELGVTEEELRRAVHTAGVLIDDVRQHLRRNRG
jgi:uncharacterized protein DUF3606